MGSPTWTKNPAGETMSNDAHLPAIPARIPFFGHEERSIDAFPNHGTRR